MSGPPPGAEGWSVAVAQLVGVEKLPPGKLLLHDAAVSTSGDASQGVEIDGKRYSHIVDPRTGIGLIGRMGVTVVAPDGITADSLTKVVAVLGPAKGIPIITETPGVSTRVVRQTDKGAETVVSKGFPKLRPLE
jgi:thiamine biosynthesis lipoprotein